MKLAHVGVLLAALVQASLASPAHLSPALPAEQALGAEAAREDIDAKQGGTACDLPEPTAASNLMQSKSALRTKPPSILDLSESMSELRQGLAQDGLVRLLFWGSMGMFGLLLLSSALAVLFQPHPPHVEREAERKVNEPIRPPASSPTSSPTSRSRATKPVKAWRPPDWQSSLRAVQADASAADAERGEDIPRVASPHIFLGLVVPLGCECRLTLPSSAFEEPEADSFVVNIGDQSGKTLMQCTLSKADWSVPEPQLAAVLHAPEQGRGGGEERGEEPGPPLAHCKAGLDDDGRRTVFIYGALDELLAQVAQPDDEQLHYVLRSGRTPLLFRGDFEKRSVEITSEQGDRLAAVQPQLADAGGCELIVSSAVDVGAVLCGLFAICQMRRSAPTAHGAAAPLAQDQPASEVVG